MSALYADHMRIAAEELKVAMRNVDGRYPSVVNPHVRAVLDLAMSALKRAEEARTFEEVTDHIDTALRELALVTTLQRGT